MNKYIKCVVCWGMVSMALLSSCNDEWDSHYESDGGVPGVSLMDLLQPVGEILPDYREDAWGHFVIFHPDLYGMGTAE